MSVQSDRPRYIRPFETVLLEHNNQRQRAAHTALHLHRHRARRVRNGDAEPSQKPAGEPVHVGRFVGRGFRRCDGDSFRRRHIRFRILRGAGCDGHHVLGENTDHDTFRLHVRNAKHGPGADHFEEQHRVPIRAGSVRGRRRISVPGRSVVCKVRFGRYRPPRNSELADGRDVGRHME